MTRVLILDEAVYISDSTNNIEKAMNTAVLLLAMRKIVGHTRLFNESVLVKTNTITTYIYNICMYIYIYIEREREEGETDRQTDRQTDRDRERVFQWEVKKKVCIY